MRGHEFESEKEQRSCHPTDLDNAECQGEQNGVRRFVLRAGPWGPRYKCNTICVVLGREGSNINYMHDDGRGGVKWKRWTNGRFIAGAN